jgi:hypothetical protein
MTNRLNRRIRRELRRLGIPETAEKWRLSDTSEKLFYLVATRAWRVAQREKSKERA